MNFGQIIMIWARRRLLTFAGESTSYAETNYAKPMMVAESKAIYET